MSGQGPFPSKKTLKKKKGNSIYNIVLRKAFVYSLHFKNRKTELTSVQGGESNEEGPVTDASLFMAQPSTAAVYEIGEGCTRE